MGFSRQESWSGLPFPSPGNLPNPEIECRSLALQADSFTTEPPGKPPIYSCISYICVCVCVCVYALLSHVWLCNPRECSPPSSSAHGILQARILEWVVISSSRGPSWPRVQTHISCVSCIGKWIGKCHLGSLYLSIYLYIYMCIFLGDLL